MRKLYLAAIALVLVSVVSAVSLEAMKNKEFPQLATRIEGTPVYNYTPRVPTYVMKLQAGESR